VAPSIETFAFERKREKEKETKNSIPGWKKIEFGFSEERRRPPTLILLRTLVLNIKRAKGYHNGNN
jgi:hypothetical protein